MRKNVCDWLRDFDAFAVENPANPGTQDVNGIEFWIELKQLDEWPSREGTPVRIEHFTPKQRIRARKRWKKGGNAFFLLQVSNDWLLLDGDVSAELYDEERENPTRGELYEKARATWTGQNSVRKELRHYLCRRQNSARDRSS